MLAPNNCAKAVPKEAESEYIATIKARLWSDPALYWISQATTVAIVWPVWNVKITTTIAKENGINPAENQMAADKIDKAAKPIPPAAASWTWFVYRLNDLSLVEMIRWIAILIIIPTTEENVMSHDVLLPHELIA